MEQIKLERAKKKEEEDKPLEFRTNINPNNKRFNKIYFEMKKKNEQKEEEFKKFAEVVHQYEQRECKFQPNLNDDNEDENKIKIKHRKLNSCELIQRLYNDELKNRIKKKENLEQKYRPTFKPKINDNSIDMSNRWRKKMKNKKDEKGDRNDISGINLNKIVKKRLNNSAVKRKNKKFDIEKKFEKSFNDKYNNTDVNIDNKDNNKNKENDNVNNENNIKIEDNINIEDNNKKEEIEDIKNNE